MSSKFQPVGNPSSFRRMAAAMWRQPRNPSIYGVLEVDATNAIEFIDNFRDQHGVRLTMTHLVTRALALGLAEQPRLNSKVRWWGKLEQRQSVDLFLQVSTDDGEDLSGIRIEQADGKSLRDIQREVSGSASRIRNSDDPTYESSRSLLRRVPWWVVRPMLRVSDFLVNELHIDLSRFGMPVDSFGSAMVTNVGMFGIDLAFSPFTSVARCSIIILVSSIKRRPWVVNGELQVRPVVRLCATLDHRIIDGYHAGKLGSTLREYLLNPQRLELADAESRQ